MAVTHDAEREPKDSYLQTDAHRNTDEDTDFTEVGVVGR